jgi:arabinan endo-1,5-alpha-L-arabinosidase
LARGDLWLSLGSWNKGGIKLVKLDKNTGKPITKPITIAAGQGTGPEAPYLHYRNGYYYLFENEGTCCNGMNVTYRIMVGRSKTITGPYLDKQGKDLAKGGGTPFLGTNAEKIGPGHVGIFREGGIDRFTFHYYDGRASGIPTLGLQTLLWSADGWPQPGSDLPGGRYAIVSQASGLALGVYNNKFDDGTPIDQFAYRGGATQQWNLSPTGDGYYSIGSLGTAKYMDLFQCSPKDGAKISQHPWMNNDCQKWRIEQTSDGAYRVVSKGSATVITLPDGTKTPQAVVRGYPWKGDISQKWLFKKLP